VQQEEAAEAATIADDGRGLPPPSGATSVLDPPTRPETVEIPPAHGPTLPGPTAAT
jgi:hypothetical protein